MGVIIPQPSHLLPLETNFELNARTVIVTDVSAFPEAEKFAHSLRTVTGFALPVQLEKSLNSLEFMLEPNLEHLGTEGYELEVNADGVTLRSSGETGLFYAGQSLRQLLPAPTCGKTLTEGVQ